MKGREVADETYRGKLLFGSVLLAAVSDFLAKKGLPAHTVSRLISKHSVSEKRRAFDLYEQAMTTWSSMGKVMETWYSNPKFLDQSGLPVEITITRGKYTVPKLIKAAGIQISKREVLHMLRSSPSIYQTSDRSFRPASRVFIMPNAELLRAAFVVQRFLMTLGANATRHRLRKPLILERNCCVSDADLNMALPVMRDIKERATAFMDSVDWELESCRARPRSNKSKTGELGVLVFAWSSPTKRKTAQ